MKSHCGILKIFSYGSRVEGINRYGVLEILHKDSNIEIKKKKHHKDSEEENEKKKKMWKIGREIQVTV